MLHGFSYHHHRADDLALGPSSRAAQKRRVPSGTFLLHQLPARFTTPLATISHTTSRCAHELSHPSYHFSSTHTKHHLFIRAIASSLTMSGFQHLADKMLRSNSRSPGRKRSASKHSDSDHHSAATTSVAAPIHYSSRITATRTHGTGTGHHHHYHQNASSPIVGATPSTKTSNSDDTHPAKPPYTSTHSLSIPDNKKTAFTASSRIPASAPSRQSVLLELEAERQKVKQLGATVERQQRAIAALNERVEKQGRDNANSALATRALYAELEAQTKWVEGLDAEARLQVRRGRGLLEKFAHLRSGGADVKREGHGK